MWSAEVVVDETLARRLLGRFPELELGSLRRFAEGWDNSVWLVNERWAFRFPQRAIGVPGLERELVVLPLLAGKMPLPVPNPVFVGEPEGDYPWPFFGSELLPGRETCDAGLDDAARLEVALQVARFLRRLHSVEPSVELPVDANARADMTRRVPHARKQLAEVERLGSSHSSTEISISGTSVESGAASGVIDWGDVCRADPAIDLQLLWSFLPPESRPAFLDAYGPVTDEQLLRARVLALSIGAALAAYGHVEGMPGVAREALEGLARTTTDA